MPTIAEQLQQIATIKANIKAAIEAKGETVGDDAFSTYPAHIGNISGGGGDNLPAFINDAMTDLVIEDGTTKIRSYIFTGMKTLKRVTIPNSLTSIGDYAFYQCSNLESVNIPPNLDKIGNGVFQNCPKLASMDLQSITSIGANAFVNCHAMTTLTIPATVTTIGNSAFHSMLYLQTLICKRTTPPTVSAATFGNGTANYTGRNTYNQGVNKLYVPQGCSSAYNTSYWASVLLDASKCGFTIAELDANGNIPT